MADLDKLRAMKFKEGGKWHRADLFDSAKTQCGKQIPEHPYVAKCFSRKTLSISYDPPKQKCKKCFTFNATDYVISCLSSIRADSITNMNFGCYARGYIYSLCYKMVEKEMIHVCYLDAKTNENYYRLGNGDDCVERLKWHPNTHSRSRWRIIHQLRELVNCDEFWLGEMEGIWNQGRSL